MTTHQISLVQQSFEKLRPIAQMAGELFYSSLFLNGATELCEGIVNDCDGIKGNGSGYWSRRIDHEHRLINKIKDDQIFIAYCKGAIKFLNQQF